jgi:hypothetical protein
LSRLLIDLEFDADFDLQLVLACHLSLLLAAIVPEGIGCPIRLGFLGGQVVMLQHPVLVEWDA